LIEVLVAMLTVAIGMLGIAGLQASSLRLSQGATVRAAVAADLADLADRVRSNPGSSPRAYAFDATTPLSGRYADQRAEIAGLGAGGDCESAGAACTPDELAADQLRQWRLVVNRDLPGGAGFVTGSRERGYRVTVMWQERNARATGCPASADVPAGVRCASLEVLP
jgi:type IV pilus assembly protein PilV